MNDELLHKTVTYASAGTYDPKLMQEMGYEVTVNIDRSSKRFIQVGDYKVVPDVIVWQPNFSNPKTGKSISIELIETPTSLEKPDIKKWSVMSSLKCTFNLVIPYERLEYVQNLILNNGIDHVTLQTYEYNKKERRYSFNTEIRYGLQ